MGPLRVQSIRRMIEAAGSVGPAPLRSRGAGGPTIDDIREARIEALGD